MSDSTTPLLGVSVSGLGDGEVPPDVEQEVRDDLQRSLYRHPREAIKFLAERGVEKLGAFQVQNTKVKDLLLDSYAMRTFGSEHRDIDWEGAWRRHLDAEKPPARGPEWVPVTEVDAYVVNIPHAADADDDGLVNPLLKRYMDGVCGIKVFGYPATKAVLNFKWDTWARRYLALELADYLVWLIAFQVFVLLLQDEDMHASTQQLVDSPRGIATVVIECLSYVAMLPFIYIEARSIEEYREDWLNAWNVIDVTAYANQTAILVMHLTRWQVASNAFSVLCAVQVLLLWVRLQYFARVLQPTRQPFMETLRAVLSEVKWFILLLVLLIIAFANSFNILFRKDQQKQEFRTVWMSAVTMFTVMMSGYEVDLYSESHNPVVSLALLVLFVFVMSMVLLNCLIALMSDAAAKVNDMEGWQFMFSRAQIIDELETTVPAFLQRKNQETWYPKYVHFLTVNRDFENLKMLEVGGSRTIEGADEEEDGSEENGGGEDGPLQEQVRQLKSELLSAKQQLERVAEVQEAIARVVLPKKQMESLFPHSK